MPQLETQISPRSGLRFYDVTETGAYRELLFPATDTAIALSMKQPASASSIFAPPDCVYVDYASSLGADMCLEM